MTSKAQVPDGWTKTTLRDQLVVCRNGLVCRQDADPMKAIPVTRIETIADGKVNWDRVGYATVEDANPEYLLQRGDILLSHINSVKHIGKVARKTDDRPMIHGMNLMALRCAESLASGFGFAVMASHQTKAYMERRAKKAVNQASINRQDIFALPLLLPPLPEQRAIATVLDSIDEAIERTEAVITSTERLRESLLHELLTRGVPGWHSEWKEVRGIGTIPADWEVVRLGDVSDVTSGLAMGPHRSPRDNPKPYLTVANVQADHVKIGKPRFMELTEREYSSRTLRTGDVVLVEGHAQISQLGRAAVVPPEADGYTFQNHFFRARSGDRCKSAFVCAYANGRNGRRYFGSFGGTPVRTSGLNTVSATRACSHYVVHRRSFQRG